VLLLHVAAAPDSAEPTLPDAASKQEPTAAAAAAAAAEVPQTQLRVLLREVVSQDDISSLSVNAAGTYLATADDTGTH
jgi:hypothetical protein